MGAGLRLLAASLGLSDWDSRPPLGWPRVSSSPLGDDAAGLIDLSAVAAGFQSSVSPGSLPRPNPQAPWLVSFDSYLARCCRLWMYRGMLIGVNQMDDC